MPDTMHPTEGDDMTTARARDLTEVKVTRIPTCDLPNCLRPAAYDAKTEWGPWANLCTGHWVAHRAYPQLGTGMGQRLTLDTKEN